ncbi:MAG: DNA gyrase inhibitor YacG [Gammaproteobacteria bacterium]|nr:DNA gyrase inhibitor YacG [Gammaproteobacteria bacterium]
MRDRVLEVTCPTCGKTIEWTPAQKWRPFCCERCKLIDLGEWLAEEKRIPGEPVMPPESSDES